MILPFLVVYVGEVVLLQVKLIAGDRNWKQPVKNTLVTVGVTHSWDQTTHADMVEEVGLQTLDLKSISGFLEGHRTDLACEGNSACKIFIPISHVSYLKFYYKLTGTFKLKFSSPDHHLMRLQVLTVSLPNSG